nr:immunoglobulin light chain junction region [Macaca mulatta]MOX45695.1 immunoglobulin light chain junction region [Macaca mulatta]MOX47153.1 immunoglobulin light chain junction region [Macaca mulatta]
EYYCWLYYSGAHVF